MSLQKYPKVMLGSMMKNAERWLPYYFKNIESLSYPKDKIEFVIMMGKCNDNTLPMIKDWKQKTGYNIKVYEDISTDAWLRVGGIYAAGSVWASFQEACKNSKCEYFMLFDVDLASVPSNLIEKLMDVDADVVAPYVWSENHRHFFDNYVFRIDNMRFHPQNPPGYGLSVPIYVDSVGTVFLVKRDCWINVQLGNPEPYFVFAKNARRMGYTIVACPFIEVIHIDLELLGIFHSQPPQEWSNWGEGWIDSNAKVKVYRRNK